MFYPSLNQIQKRMTKLWHFLQNLILWTCQSTSYTGQGHVRIIKQVSLVIRLLFCSSMNQIHKWLLESHIQLYQKQWKLVFRSSMSRSYVSQGQTHEGLVLKDVVCKHDDNTLISDNFKEIQWLDLVSRGLIKVNVKSKSFNMYVDLQELFCPGKNQIHK